MKKRIQNWLQRLLGFRNYLFVFSVFKIKTLRWDKKEGDFFHFRSLLPADAVVLDIGANIGIMTVLLARACSRGKVVAVEPIPENFAALQRVCRWFGLKNVEFIQAALGTEEGELEMVMPEVEHVKMQGLSHVVHASIPDFNEGRRYKVPQYRLDTLPQVQARLDAIKIDVENFEFFVFQGGRDLLARHKPLIYCELWENENRQKCFDLLTGLGYRIQVLDQGRLRDYVQGTDKAQNFFFLPA